MFCSREVYHNVCFTLFDIMKLMGQSILLIQYKLQSDTVFFRTIYSPGDTKELYKAIFNLKVITSISYTLQCVTLRVLASKCMCTHYRLNLL